jgi:hypothetical protein
MYSEAIEAQAGMLAHVRRSLEFGVRTTRAKDHLYKGASGDYQPAIKRMMLTLEVAAPFYWDPDLCFVLEACAPSMPEWELRLDDLPARSGYVHFGHALHLPMPGIEEIKQAIESGARPRDVPLDYRLDMTGMAWGALEGGQAFVATFLRTSFRVGGEPGMMTIVDEGMSMKDMIGQVLNSKRNESVWADTPHETEHEKMMARRAELQVRYIAAALDFINQPLLTVRRKALPDRHTRKRAQREGRPLPEVNVVELRRKQYLTVDEPDEAPSEREYRHRWMVGMATGGYWQRYHTGVGRTGMTRRLILPYMKLADRTDLPILAPRETVFVVDR